MIDAVEVRTFGEREGGLSRPFACVRALPRVQCRARMAANLRQTPPHSRENSSLAASAITSSETTLGRATLLGETQASSGRSTTLAASLI